MSPEPGSGDARRDTGGSPMKSKVRTTTTTTSPNTSPPSKRSKSSSPEHHQQQQQGEGGGRTPSSTNVATPPTSNTSGVVGDANTPGASTNDSSISPNQSSNSQSPSYISSASSTTGASPFTPMSTIATGDFPRKNSDDVSHLPPVTPFFHMVLNQQQQQQQQQQLQQGHGLGHYDSDGSDGSLVLSPQPTSRQKRTPKPPKSGDGMHSQTLQLPSTPQHQHPQRDRFPSFDSMASTGSVVRYVSSANASPVLQTQPAEPLVLPYHERKKRQQERQEQQQQQPSTNHPNPGYPNQNINNNNNNMNMDPRNMPFAPMGRMPPGNHAPPNPYTMDPMTAAFASMYGMPPMGFPPPPPHQYGNYPPGGPGYPGYPHPQQQQQQPNQPRNYQGYPPQLPPYVPQMAPYPYPPHYGGGAPGPPMMPPIPDAKSAAQPKPQPPKSQPPPQMQPPKPQPPPQRLLPYRSLAKTGDRPPKQATTDKASRPPPLPRASSSGAEAGGNDSQPTPTTQRGGGGGFHVPMDSGGSMSSLGSNNGRGSSGDDGTRQPPQYHHRSSSSGGGSGGFLGMLVKPFTKSKKQKEPPNVHVFHRQNQEFLYQQSPRGAAPAPPLKPQHQRVGSQDRPPASRGTHKRLPSISNDNWEDGDSNQAVSGSTGGEASSGGYSTSNESDGERMRLTTMRDGNAPHELTALLPPPGISTNEREGDDDHYPVRRSKRNSFASRKNRPGEEEAAGDTLRWDNRTATALLEKATGKGTRKSRKKKRSRQRSNRYVAGDSSDNSSSDSSYDYRQWTQKRARMLEKERAKLIEQWKAEARAEAELTRREQAVNQWHNRLGRSMNATWHKFQSRSYRLMTAVEAFIANLPLTIGAIAMAVVTLGVVWFKFAEENLDSCEPVHFHSSQCTFPEFPGCFYCDTEVGMYQFAVYFLFTCKVIAGLFAMAFVAKILLATRVVLDEMTSPTTASPAGLLCMTTVCVFAGRGLIGQIMVTAAACVHLGLVIWFIYMALAYQILPEPSWFPNTVGVGLTAVKTWLYYPMPGHLLMAISLSLNFFFFPVSLFRVGLNKKVSATVGWMQMSAPAVSLYALTIMAQPSFEEEHPDVTNFQRVHRMVYLPCMHVMCALSIVGFLASVHSLWIRWHDFKRKEFSPAHAAFCFPTLSHVNAIQAYRGAVISFSDIHPHSWRMVVLYAYWLVLLLGGTIATIWITAKFLYCLPTWTNFDLSDEEEPPAPYETMMSLQDMVTAGEAFRQPYVSPAVLQANETGALVLARSEQDGTLRYVRTRRLKALGFEPTMNWSEMQQERDVLLEWVGQNPPKRRHRTLSVPGVDFNYGLGNTGLGTGNVGVYGTLGLHSPLSPARRRADTSPRSYSTNLEYDD